MTKRKPKPVADLMAAGLARAVEYGDCLEWQGKMGNGNTVPVVSSREGRDYSAEYSVPRYVWEKANGPIPAGLVVYRKCCNNCCVSLKHIAVGTRAEWMENRKKLGLTKHATQAILNLTKGARNRPTVVNTLDKARQVRMLLADHTRDEVAALTGVSLPMVNDIALGRSWKDYSSPFAGLGARP
jgi:hypothetical protein